MMTMRTFTRLPSIQNGFELDDQFSVVVPIARTNLVINPSFETNTTSWTALGGSIARTTTQQYHGAYSLAITPTAATTDGARFDTVSLIAGTLYAYSAKVLGIAGRAYKLAIETTAGVELSSVTFIATGRWQWVIGYRNENTTTTRRVTLRKAGGTDTLVFYLDGVQVEAINVGETASTYLDGDQLGFVPNQSPIPYYWHGTPHASTSARSGLTRAGGMVVKFKDFGFLLTAIVGLGLAAPANIVTEYARLDGGYDSYTRKPSRQFTLSGQFQSHLDYLQLRQYRGGLARLLDRDLIGQDQRLLIRREVVDPCGTVQSSVCRVVGKYQGGLSGNTDNQTAEQAALTFTQYLPNVLADGESGGALLPQTNVTNMNYISRRSPNGVWSAMGTGGAGGSIVGTQALAIGLDGRVYAGGSWTSMNSVANTGKIAYWDPIALTWNAMGTGATGGDVFAIFVAADGQVYAGGSFTAMGGVANTSRIARWTGSAWASVTGAGAANGDVGSIVQAPNGTFYIGGNFTSIGGTAANRVVQWNGAATWTAMGTGAATLVNTLIIGPNGTDVYAGGAFVAMGGVADTGRVARWDGTAWNALATGLPTGGSEFVSRFAFGPNAVLYLAGQFDTAGGVTADNIASWNGVTFTALSSGLAYSPSTINEQGNALLVTPAGMYVGGLFDSAGPITLPDSMAIWTGGGFVPVDIDLNGGALVSAFEQGPDGTLYVGHNSTGTAIAASTTTITNTGTAKSYPTVTIGGPSSGTARIYSIINATTNRNIFLNLTLNAGETATLVFQPDNLSFTSTFQGDITSKIQSGSNTADFFLQPGVNSIAFLSSGSTVVATLYYRPAFLSLDDVP